MPGIDANFTDSFGPVYGATADGAGNVYIVGYALLCEVAKGGVSTLAGNGTTPSGGDDYGGPATGAELVGPQGVAADSAGNLYFSDGPLIRKISNGVIATVAGTPSGFDYTGDGGPATSATFGGAPSGTAVDSAGNLYIADLFNDVIREVSNGVITTVAGSPYYGPIGDGGPATSADLYNPTGVAVDLSGNLYIADSGHNLIREVSNGVITTVAGNGDAGYSGDGGPAIGAQLDNVWAIAVDSMGNLYIVDDCRVREISNGLITTIAGNGTCGYGGDYGPATAAQLAGPTGIAVDSSGNVYIADGTRVRVVSNGVITTIAGNGISGFGGDNGPATGAEFSPGCPYFFTGVLAVDSAGNLYLADSLNSRIRLLTPSTAPAATQGVNIKMGRSAH